MSYGQIAWQRPGRRWKLIDASRRRQWLAVGTNLLPALVALAALPTVAPPSSWDQPVLLGALAAIAAVAYLAEARLKVASRIFFGATLVVALVALAIGGPLPALAVWAVPDLLARLALRRESLLSPALIANVSSYALAVLAGAALLALAGSPSGAAIAPALFSAGVVMAAVNFCFARLTFAPFYQGYRPAALLRDEFWDLMPAMLAMLVVADLAAVLAGPLGVGALGLLALVILAPGLTVERLAGAQSAARLSRADATRLYTEAIADVLDLPRAERRELACAADLVEPVADPIEARGLDWRGADVSRVAFLALHANERWTGGGWPAGLPADAAPQGSRIIAVARDWAGLTASGTLELDQSEATLALAAQSGRSLDPAVVDAALRAVADEESFARDPGFQPRLHRLRVPRAMRRRVLPELLPRLTGDAAA